MIDNIRDTTKVLGDGSICVTSSEVACGTFSAITCGYGS
jgi:hypothetical protein